MHIVSLPATPNMIGYGDHHSTSSLLSDTGNQKKPPSRQSSPPSERRINSAIDKRSGVSLQLTPLWEYVVRTQSLPDSVELQQIFLELSDRLRDPEWEVRQHSLRVLIDLIPVMHDGLDEKVAIILNDLIENLGHPAPAVRKGALDSLRVYLSHSKHSEEVLSTIAYEGLENISDHHLQGNVTVGLILSLPSLIFPHKNGMNGNIEYPNVQYIVRLLTRKLVQVIFQEVTLRTLVKIRQLIGNDKFEEYLEDIAPFKKSDFDLLCEVYNVTATIENDHQLEPKMNFQLSELNMNKRMIFEPNIIHNKYWNNNDNNDTSFDFTVENVNQVLVPFPTPINKPLRKQFDELSDGKIILKTEIKLNSETALTMTILEERSEKDESAEEHSESDEDDELNNDINIGVVKVLTDDSEFDVDDDFNNRRRTPRRVRFGGEVVKLRTPDSDTTIQSDEEQLTSIASENNDVIEITLSTTGTHQIIQKPRRKTRSHIPIPITRSSQIKLDIVPVKTVSSAPSSPVRTKTKLHRRLVYQSTPDLAKEYFKSSKTSSKKKLYEKSNRTNFLAVNTKRKTSRADDVFSPIPVHEEVQVLHNLQAIDQKCLNKQSVTSDDIECVNENLNLNKHFESTISEINKELNNNNNNNNNMEVNRMNWFVDEEESLTSSSGSGSYSNEKSWEDLNLIEYNIIQDLHDKENWRSRVRGREALLSALRIREVLNGVESRAASFLHLLFSSDRHPRVLAVTQAIISMIIDSFSVETLQSRLSQITAGLARIGGPISIKLSTQLMKKLTPATVAEHFLNNHSLTGRSSKVKENALQIVIYTVLKFPSTEFNVASLASRGGVSVIDRKRRIRHAALELLALLGQIGSVGLVVDAVLTILNNIDYKSKDDVLEAIRARLSRKQLPAADENFIVTYAPLTEAEGADVDWIYAGSGSMSPSSAKMRANAIYKNRLHSAEPIFFHTSNENYTNLWEEPCNNAINSNDKYQIRPRTTGYKDEVQTYNLDTSRIWAIDPSIHSKRSSFSGGPLKPVYIVKSNPNELQQRSFPPLNKERISAEETPPSQSNPSRNYKNNKPPFTTADSFSSSGSTESPSSKQNSRRDRFSGIPIPIQRGTGAVHYNHSSSDLHLHQSRKKIPSAPVISTERQNDLQSGYVRHTISSGSDLQHFYNTPPAESYLPPIDLNEKHKSFTSIASSQTSSSLDDPEPDSPITISSRSRSVSNSYLNKDVTDNVSTSAYVTSERSTSFESSPAKSEKKLVSDSDFDIEDTNFQNDEDVASVSGGYKSASSTNLSNYEADSGIVIEITNTDNEIIERKSVNSAPAQQISALENDIEIESTNSILSNTLLNTSTKSLPGSIINLEKVPKVIKLPPSKPTYLLKRQKINAKQTVGRLLSETNKQSNTTLKSSQVCPFPDTLKPFDKPKEAFNLTMNQLDNTDWEVTVSGLQNLVRLIRFHPDLIENQIHPVAVSLGRQIKNLRSQVARSACMAAAELFQVPKRALEVEMEEIAAPLLHRTADTNKFLRADTNTALNSMCTNMNPSKVINILAARGAMHHNAVVRCAAARLISSMVERLGYEKVFSFPKETRDRLFITSANLLTEGSLETRNHAKQIFKNLMNHFNFQKVLTDVVPATTLRHISKTLKSIK